jgi:hypothetical protein
MTTVTDYEKKLEQEIAELTAELRRERALKKAYKTIIEQYQEIEKICKGAK